MIAVLILIAAFGQQPAAGDLSQLQAAVQRESRDPSLWVRLGLAYWERNDAARALEAFERAVAVGPSSAEAHNWLGVALMGKADLPKAVAELRKAVALDHNYARAYTNLGSALAKSGDLAEAVEMFQQAVALVPGDLAARMNLGVALREKGDTEAALQHLRYVADREPSNAGVQYQLGQTLRQLGDHEGAVRSFESALKLDPELREAYYSLGLALKALPRKPAPADPPQDAYRSAQEALRRGDLNAAKDQLLSVLAANEKHAGAHNLLGFLLGQQGDLKSALEHLNRAIALQPDMASAHYNLGVALWYDGSKQSAVAELQESIRLDPAAGEVYAFLGMAQRETGDLDSARRSLQRAIALLPPLAATYIDLGIVFLRGGERDKALGQFEAALNAASAGPAPDWDNAIARLRQSMNEDAALKGRADVHNVLGRMLGRKGADPKEVAAEFREAVGLRPDYAEAHNNLGLVLAQTGDDEAAIASFREAVRSAADYADAHANLGAALTPTDAGQAIRELEKAVTLAPQSAKAQFNLAVAYAADPRFGPAKEIEQLRKVVAMDPSYAKAHLALGKALLRSRSIPEAVAEIQKAVQLEPESGEAHYQLGLALARGGRNDEAAAELKKGRELTASDERNRTAALDIAEGRAAAGRGEIDAAIGKFRHALEVVPDSPEAQQELRTALEKQAQRSRPAVVSAEDDPQKVEAFESYIRDGNFREVEPLLVAYVKERPKSWWGWYALGYCQFGQRKIGESIRALSTSLQLNLRNAEAHKILGRDLMMIGRFEAAQTEFQQGIRLNPQSAEVHYNLGKLFSIQDDWARARSEFEAALRLDSSYMEAYDALGFALEALGDDAGALANYEKAARLNEQRKSKFASAYVNLSAYYNRRSEPDKALPLARQAIEMNPESDRAWFQMAKAQELLRQLDAAVDSLNRAVYLNPRASSYFYVLATLYRRLGKAEDSRKALELFTRLDRESNELDKLRRGAGAARE